MNWYSIFYWLTVADSVKEFFDTTSNIFTTIAVLAFIVMIIGMIAKAVEVGDNNITNEEDEKTDSEVRAWETIRKLATRIFYPTLVLALLTWFGYMATPTKKDCLFIVAGGAVGNFLTSDSSAKQLPADVTRFLHLSLQKEVSELGEEAKKELGLQSPKEKLIEKVKTMTKEELVNYLQSDSTFSVK